MDKVEQAKVVIEECRTEEGFHSSTDRYPEFFLRDLVFSEDSLLRLGYEETVKTEFEGFLRRQRTSGQLPTVITSPLRRIFNQRFHFWTSDTEILFLSGVRKYVNFTGDSKFLDDHAPQFDLCLRFIEGRLNRFGFIPGMDWRDALMTHRDKFLLTNQVLLAEMYDLLGRKNDSDSLKSRIAENFRSGDHEFFADYIWWDEEGGLKRDFGFDCFGNSLCILNEVATRPYAEGIARLFEGARTQFGYRNSFPPYKMNRLTCLASFENVNAFVRTGAIFRNRPNTYQNSSVWPFVESKIFLAFRKAGLKEEAERIFGMILRHERFNEWYNPLTGEPKGSEQQLWTASSLLEANENFS